jgi:hypothetical protein
LERLVKDLRGGQPEIGGGRARGGGLDRELDVGVLGFRVWVLDEGGGGGRRYGKAAGFGDVGDVDVEPLAREVAEGRLLSTRVLERCLSEARSVKVGVMG